MNRILLYALCLLLPALIAGPACADSLGAPRAVLSANAFRYVSATGSDTADGLTAATAWRTLQHSQDVISSTIDLGGPNIITVQLAPGTYCGVVLRPTVGGWIGAGWNVSTILGDPGHPDAYVIDGCGYNAITAVGVTTPWLIKGVKLTAAGNSDIASDFGSRIYVANVDFGAANLHNQAIHKAQIEIIASYSVTGAANGHLNAGDMGEIIVASGVTAYISGGLPIGVFSYAGFQAHIYSVGACFAGGTVGYSYSYEYGGGIKALAGEIACPAGASPNIPGSLGPSIGAGGGYYQ